MVEAGPRPVEKRRDLEEILKSKTKKVVAMVLGNEIEETIQKNPVLTKKARKGQGTLGAKEKG